VSDAGDGSDYDHGDWADAQLNCGPDVTAPTVTVVSPTAGATGQALNANITATFSESMSAASLTTGTVTLVPQGSSSAVAASVTYLDATRTITLDPTSSLASNTTYTATVKGGAAGAKDLAGNGLATDKVWTFATGSVTTPTGTPIYPGQDAQSIINSLPAGTTFLFKAGVHRMQTIRPRDGDKLNGEPGAILSGARLLTSFTRSGSYWVASGQTQQGVAHGSCLAGYPRCNLPEQLFVDDQVLLHVGTLAEVGPGKWYFDYAGDRIYFADDPTGRIVETSVTTTAFEPTANNVTVNGLIVEKYANIAQHGAVSAEGKTGWVISANEVRWNHGLGIRVGPFSRVTGNKSHHNGQLGIGGVGNDILVEANEIAYNNIAHFDWGWEAGATKFTETNRLIVRGNFVHHNYGPGLWTDINNINTITEGNTVEDNDMMGIFHEISYAAIIRNNIVRRNGLAYPGWLWGAGILVAASPNVEIYGNTLEGNADGIGAIQQNRSGDAAAYGPHEISNLYVHDNVVTITQGQSGLVQDIGDNSYFTSRNNRFEHNQYHLGSNPQYFEWMNGSRTELQWKGYGLDVTGTFIR
jgi:parallel beta-helix repeat protein